MELNSCARENISAINFSSLCDTEVRKRAGENQCKKFDLDYLIQQIGPFGKFQRRIVFLICITNFFLVDYTTMFIFTAGEVNYRCRIPECEAENAAFSADFLNFTTPAVEGNFAKCKRFPKLSNISLEDQCQGEFFDKNHTEECSELIYQNDEKTIQNEWNLGCSEDWKLSLVGTVNGIGQVVCLPLVGYISDRYGRRTAFILSAFFAAFLGLLRSFSTNFTMFVILEFLDPALNSGMFNAGFLLGMELVGPSRRALVAFCLLVACTMGSVGLGVLVMFVKHWRLLIRIVYVPSFIFMTYYWFIPESIRWLYKKNRLVEASNVIISAAKTNSSQLTLKAQTMLKEASKNPSENDLNKIESVNKDTKESRLGLILKSKTLLIRIVNCSFYWAAMSFAYTGLNMNSVMIAGDKHVNFILNILIEIPANLICCWLMEKIGRRTILSLSQISCGLACIASIFLKEAPVSAQTTVFLIGKLGASVSYSIVSVYTSEIFPTTLRHTLVSICSILGRTGSTLAPFTLFLGKYMESMEMILFASMTIPAGIFILFAPETLNQPLPDTIQEAEDIGKIKKCRHLL
uniref:Putative organic cation transporter protein-like isoform x1 zootermopsis nevadensis n=1 Tax=Lutzomyia longipalpis TaxID=7200 RepID=A0A7G3AT57_LUTLO